MLNTSTETVVSMLYWVRRYSTKLAIKLIEANFSNVSFPSNKQNLDSSYVTIQKKKKKNMNMNKAMVTKDFTKNISDCSPSS